MKIQQAFFRNMARSPRVYVLSKVFESNDLGLSFSDDTMVVTLSKSTKKSRELVYTKKETSPMELVRFASLMLRGRVVYDKDDTVQDDESWVLQAKFDEAVKEAPSNSDAEPGMAYHMRCAQRYDAKENEYYTIFPVKHDGSYAYVVKVSDLHIPHQWKKDMEDGGFQVLVSKDGKRFYGSRFPGGDKGFVPVPMALSPLKLRPPDFATPVPQQVGKKPTKKPVPLMTWCQIPTFKDCASLVGPFSNRAEPEIVAELIRNPPRLVKQHLAIRDVKQCQDILKSLRNFVDDWVPSGNKIKPNIAIFMRKMKGLCQSETSYCAMFCMLNSNFRFDWEANTVMTVEQHRVEAEAEAKAEGTDEEVDEDVDVSDESSSSGSKGSDSEESEEEVLSGLE